MSDAQPKIIVTEDGSHTIYLKNINETYHSFHGAWQESNHVFITAGLEHLLNTVNPTTINLLEIGFGTGLNAILTVQKLLGKSNAVNYHSLEPFPLDPELIEDLNYTNYLKNEREGQLFKTLHTSTWHRSVPITGNFTLNKQKITLQNYEPDQSFELIYFDAFAPSKQSELWTYEVIKKVTGFLTEGGVLVTYCARGQFKRDLLTLGLHVETLPGPPGKKEMVRATKN